VIWQFVRKYKENNSWSNNFVHRCGEFFGNNPDTRFRSGVWAFFFQYCAMLSALDQTNIHSRGSLSRIPIWLHPHS